MTLKALTVNNFFKNKISLFSIFTKMTTINLIIKEIKGNFSYQYKQPKQFNYKSKFASEYKK